MDQYGVLLSEVLWLAVLKHAQSRPQNWGMGEHEDLPSIRCWMHLDGFFLCFKTSQNLSNPVDVHDMFSEPSPIVSGGLFKEFWEKCLRWKGGGFPPGSSRFDIAMVNNPIFIDEKGYTQIHQCKPDLRPISMFFLPRSNQIDRLEKALPLQVG
jgi:hypothetical protein